MNLLLDTHSMLWFIEGNERLTLPARSAITDPVNRTFVSVASLWEIVIKVSLGKLSVTVPIEVLLHKALDLNGFHTLAIETKHLATLLNLPLHHRDSFDRMMVAQALTERMTVVSADGAFDEYGIGRIW